MTVVRCGLAVVRVDGAGTDRRAGRLHVGRRPSRELVGDDINDHAQIVRATIAGIGRRQTSRLA